MSDKYDNEDRNLRKNGSGYNDPTAYHALKNIHKDEGQDRHYRLIQTIICICDLAGFDVKGRIILKDRETGKTWR